jgi:hypothetical protein
MVTGLIAGQAPMGRPAGGEAADGDMDTGADEDADR